MEREQRTMSIRFPEEVLRQVAKIAARENRSTSGQIRHLVDEALKRRAKDREEAKEETA